MDDVTLLTQWMKQHANPERAVAMEAYQRNQFPFLGIPAPERAQLLKTFFAKYGEPSDAQWEPIVRRLWDLPEREYQYVAIWLVEKRKMNFAIHHIDLIEFLITNKSWWDTVDTIASHFAGGYLRKYPERIPAVTERWISSSHMWLQRSAILFQLSYKQQTDSDLLFRLIRRCEGSKQFFINKAIGWALREYAKTNRSAVERFVQETNLHPLSAREALKVRRKA
jgi:3-methyladenine DNA glycosylase AlkD